MSRFLLVAALLAVAASALAIDFPNPGFETARAADPTLPDGWRIRNEGGTVVLDSLIVTEGERSLCLIRTAEQGFGVGSQSVQVNEYAGRMLVLTGKVRTEGVEEGYAGLWLRLDSDDGVILQLDNMGGRGVSGTTLWTDVRIEMFIPEEAFYARFGPIFPGRGAAWFDDLEMTLEDAPEPPVTRMLTDEELTIVPTSPDIHPEWTEWLNANAHPLRSLDHDEDFSDLAFLGPLVEGRRLVQLGESGHGVAEFDMAKVRLIKYLHAELGYDVIMFESGILSCYLTQRDLDGLSPSAAMRSSIFGVWHAEETLELFRYIKETRKTDRPLILAGCDYQHTTGIVMQKRAAFMAEVAGRLQRKKASEVRQLEERLVTELGGGPVDELDEKTRNELIKEYRNLAKWFDRSMDDLEKVWADEPQAPWVARQTAWGEAELLDDYRPGEYGGEGRDRSMAENAHVVLDRMYPGRKVIHWAHNFHIRHRNKAVVGNDQKTTGQFLAERRRDEMYTVGLYMGRGEAAMNDRRIYPVPDPVDGMLAAVLEQARRAYLFVDLSRAPRGPATSWMDEPINARSWGTGTMVMNLRDQYDAILYVDEVRPPLYR